MDENMSNENLKHRTKRFALDVIKFVEALPRERTCDVLGRQLLRSGTSVAANYRAACRAKSPADFISKLGTVEEEADESMLWMELLFDAGKARQDSVSSLLKEADELLAIMVASINTAKKSSSRRQSSPNSALRTPHSALS
jgi:four helix bundle protein